MIKILQGPTGCGKTYQAFNRLGKKTAIYCAPCRQLVYETACKYGDRNSNIITSDITIGSYDVALSFRTYECVNRKDIRNYDVLIIDEAHFMNDKDRGPHLVDLTYFAHKCGKEVVLLSATMPFHIEGAKYITLPPRGESFNKEQVSFEEAIAKMEDGVPTLIFHKFKGDCGYFAQKYKIKGGIITADTPVQERVRIVQLYNEGKITLIEATNAMAQGVNVPCENLINIYNNWDDPACYIQKIGRLGRTGVTRQGATLSYCCVEKDWGEYVPVSFDSLIKGSKEKLQTLEKSCNLKIIKNKSKSEIKDFDLKTPATAVEKAKLRNNIKREWWSK